MTFTYQMRARRLNNVSRNNPKNHYRLIKVLVEVRAEKEVKTD